MADPAANAAAVPVVPPFALAPALLNQAQPWDYSTREGHSIYKGACAPLPYKFEGKKSSLTAFLLAVRTRAEQYGWQDIFEITIGQDANGANINRNLLTHYGEITLEQVRADADYIGTPSRNAQMSHQMFQCLHSTVDKESSDRMVTEQAKYLITDVPDGPSYLRTLIDTFFINTDAKPTHIRLKIAEAYNIIAEKDYNIDVFNTEINGYVQQLHALGTTTQDLFAHLTKAYKQVPDKAFKTYISNKIDDHDDNTHRLTAEQLMDLARAKYDEMVEDNIWMLQDDADKQLVALTAQLEQVEIQNKGLQSKLQRNFKRKDAPSKQGKRNWRKGKGNANNDKWKWKEIPPKPGQKNKTFEGKTYNWCIHHERWTLHTSSACRHKDRKNSPPTGDNKEKNEQTGYQAFFDDDWDHQSDDEQETL